MKLILQRKIYDKLYNIYIGYVPHTYHVLRPAESMILYEVYILYKL